VNRRWLLGISSMLFLMLVPFSCYVVALPILQKEWGLDNAAGASVFSAYLVGSAISSLVVVPLADRLPLRALLVGSVTVSVGSHLLFPVVAGGALAAALLRLLAGAGHAGAYVLGIRLVFDRVSAENRGRAVGLFVSFGFAGTTLSYLFMGEAIAWLGSWRAAYLAVALASTPSIALVLALSRGARVGEGVARRGGLVALGVLRNPRVFLLTVAYALHAAELYVARLWFPLLLGAAFVAAGATAGDALSKGARLAGLMFTLGVPAVFVGGALSDRIGRAASAALIFTASGLMSLAVGWLLAYPGLRVALGALYGFATAADSAIYSTAIVEIAPPEAVGSAQAVQSFIGFAVAAAAPVVAGHILDATRSIAGWTFAFGFNAALAIPAVVCLLVLRRGEEGDQRLPSAR
jgi:MFS family permease